MWRWLAALFLALLPLSVAKADERVRDFHSDVAIARDGKLTVTETIRIAVEGNQIKRGINRDFPTSYRSRLGQRTRVSFDVLSVTRDGQPEPFKMIGLSNGERVRIGNADVLLEPGDHTYAITYTTDRQLVFTDQYDELYWNVTGNDWTFPIDVASVRIALPTGATFGQRFMYTGPQGATGSGDAEVTGEGPGYIAFRTTRPLAAGEGMTVAAAFPKGVVDAPSHATRAGWWLADWAPLASGILAVLGLLFYQLRAWWVAGRGPPAGTVVPRFEPPDGMSAAATRYVSQMGMDNRAFTAAIVQSAVARQLHIDKRDGGWFSSDDTVLTRTPGGEPMGQAEREMLDALISTEDGSVELKQKNYRKLQGARSALEKVLEADYKGKLFLDNLNWAVAGLLAIPLSMLVIVIISALVGAIGLAGFWTPLLGMAGLFGILLCWRMTQSQAGCMLALAWLGLIGSAMVAVSSTFGAVILALEGGAWPVMLPMVTLPVALFAFKWMAAPTREGRQVMDQIAGFEHYLGITEEDRLNTLHPPEKTPELFERYLPYAIALEVENRWADRFASVLAAAAATAGAGAGAMSWYSGSGNAWDDPGGFASSVGSSLNSSVSSAATSPSSSGGGSGGGGSSGGGGGGGGGSGW